MRFALATSDLGAYGRSGWGCDEADDPGAPHLLTVPDDPPAALGCLAEYPPFLEWRVDPLDPDRADMMLEVREAARCLAFASPGTCTIRQPLAAVLRLLAEGGEARTSGFLREGSDLLVVLAAAGDDCSIEDPSVLDDPPGTGETASLRCAAREDGLLPPAEFHERLSAAVGPRNVMVHAIAGVPYLDWEPPCLLETTVQDIDAGWPPGGWAFFADRCLSDEGMRIHTDCPATVVDGVCPACEAWGSGAAPSRRIVSALAPFGFIGLSSICAGAPSWHHDFYVYDVFCCPATVRTTGLGLGCEGGSCPCSAPCVMHEILEGDGPCLDPRAPLLDAGGDPVLLTDDAGAARRVCVLPQARLATDSTGECSLPTWMDRDLGVSTTGGSRIETAGWMLWSRDTCSEVEGPIWAVDGQPLYDLPFTLVGLSPEWGSLLILACTAGG